MSILATTVRPSHRFPVWPSRRCADRGTVRHLACDFLDEADSRCTAAPLDSVMSCPFRPSETAAGEESAEQGRDPLTYGSYLQVDKLLGCMAPESEKRGSIAHDEMLFITIHQSGLPPMSTAASRVSCASCVDERNKTEFPASHMMHRFAAYELWFRQLIFEMDSIRELFSNEVCHPPTAVCLSLASYRRLRRTLCPFCHPLTSPRGFARPAGRLATPDADYFVAVGADGRNPHRPCAANLDPGHHDSVGLLGISVRPWPMVFLALLKCHPASSRTNTYFPSPSPSRTLTRPLFLPPQPGRFASGTSCRLRRASRAHSSACLRTSWAWIPRIESSTTQRCTREHFTPLLLAAAR